ncbi:u9-Nephitoxin-Nsp1a_1 [Trichonephila inaurata madagascariensis]|uniref:U9-Nephitoxin-Nsp1a_1 n=1 Tax=Trichonephila inaurata madagascariensis TaxID=2747483 RepID=A0A8X7BZG2_9ARAC|nr:u9-Nephitoxin-Nsp1a_1 [Trichonephila inaurata madagascariensis]
MHFLAIICGALFVTIVTWTNAVSVNEIHAMKKDFCENKKLGDKMQECFELLEKIVLPKEHEAMKKECCPSLADKKKGSEMRQWYCESDVEGIQKCNNCQEQKMKDMKNLEEIQKILAPFEECLMRVLLNSTDSA